MDFNETLANSTAAHGELSALSANTKPVQVFIFRLLVFFSPSALCNRAVVERTFILVELLI